MRSAGVSNISAFDINATSPTLGPLIQQRARESQTPLVSSPAELAASADILFSAVTASSALDAARQTVALPQVPSHLYRYQLHLPQAETRDRHAHSRHRSRFRRSGRDGSGASLSVIAFPCSWAAFGAAALPIALSPFGMRFEIVSENVGTAVAVKMCRSIVVKGLEALLFECVMGASKYGAEDRVFASLQESFPGIDWKKLANYVVGRVVVHGERRAREMEEVAETLRSSGVEPIMAEATARLQDWSARMDLKSHFGPEGPSSYPRSP